MKNSTPVSLSVVIVHHDENERRILRDSFGALPDVHVAGERSDLESGMTLARQVAPAILVLELPRNPEETLAATGEFRLEYPDSAIVYSSDRLDADTVLRALRAGATEVLARPFHPDTLTATVDRIRSLRSHREGTPRHRSIVSVYGAKGGNGVSTIAANLAIAMGADGRHDVVLVDLDDQSGDAAFILGLTPERSLLDVARSAHIDSTGLHDALLKHATGLHVLAQPERREPDHGISAGQATQILDVCSSLFDIVVVDTPHVLDPFTLAVLGHSTGIVFVVEPNVPSVRANRRALEVLRRHDLGNDPNRIHLVVNRQESRADVTLAQVTETLGLPVFATIANDWNAVTHAINTAQPLCAKGGHGKVVHDLTGLARMLEPATEAVPAGGVEPEATAPRGHRLFHLLRRSFER
ncbi:MAG: hypothetical protein RL005_947 [Planctomycetota bacterium]|jgi:pilus assembly protein CpaE